MKNLATADWLRFNRASRQATDERPAGERHLVALIERGPHGLALVTVGAVVSRGGGYQGRVEYGERLTFETFPAARAFVSAWVWYRVVSRAGGGLSGSGRHP
jgi:hypothetical protein